MSDISRLDHITSKYPPLLTEPQLRFLRQKSIIECGVYVLWMKRKIVYIGKSRNMQSRIGQHAAKSDIKFDGYSCITVETEAEAGKLEERMIRRYNPKYNKLMVFKPDYFGGGCQQPITYIA